MTYTARKEQSGGSAGDTADSHASWPDTDAPDAEANSHDHIRAHFRERPRPSAMPTSPDVTSVAQTLIRPRSDVNLCNILVMNKQNVRKGSGRRADGVVLRQTGATSGNA